MECKAKTFGGATTVQLHGLPMGSALVLLNGRRIETSGSTQAFGQEFFDLNNIPLAAVERVEIVPQGSSAIYGSDAIAGVVNILLKNNFDGLEANTKYGQASGIDESDSSLAWGKRWDKASIMILGSFQTRSELRGFDRSITRESGLHPFWRARL